MVRHNRERRTRYIMNIKNDNPVCKWIGLAHVRPMPGNSALGGSTGAYVAVVGIADDVDAFARIVTAKLNEYDFQVIGIEDIEMFEKRSARCNVDADVTRMAASLNMENPIALATFHAYNK
jgi:hypothetical protein